MPSIDNRYDVFISYSHKDNPALEYPITQLVKLLKTTYSDHYGEEIEVFFDEDGLKPGDLWENKLLESLRQSAVMVVILSSDYYSSDYCYKEWRHFRDVEIHYSLPGEGIIANKYSEYAAADNIITPTVNIWIQDLSNRQFCDISDWEKNRDTEAFKQRLLTVCGQIRERKLRLKERTAIPSNVRPHNPNFTGRAQEIGEIHAELRKSSVGVITAIKGIGGIGKSTVAYEYAHAYIDYYKGGTYNFNAEGQDDFRIALASIAAITGIEFTDEEKKRLDLQCQRVWRMISQGPPALLILDNVDKPDILKRITDYAPDRHKLHVLVTSRQGFVAGKSIHEFRILPLEQSLSLDLLLKLFPARDEDERDAAELIARRLDGHPLSITMVGTFLANRNDVSYASQLEWLEDEGIGSLDKISNDILLDDYAHPVPTQIFEQVFSLLEPDGKLTAEMRALEYAALLPPDSIPLPWICELVKNDFPEIATATKSPVSPWKRLLEKLERFQLLLPSVEGPQIGTMHRLIQEAIQQRHDNSLNRQLAERLIDYAYSRSDFLDESVKQGKIPDESLWKIKLRPIGGVLEHVDFTDWARKIALFENSLGSMLKLVGTTSVAWMHYEESLGICRLLADKSPGITEWQWDLSDGLANIADILEKNGDLTAALRNYEESLEINRCLVGINPVNTKWQRSLIACLDNITGILEQNGDLTAALRNYEESLEICRRLGEKDPGNTELQWDLSALLNNNAGILEKNGDLTAAQRNCEESLEINRRLTEIDPANTEWQYGLSYSLLNVAHIMEENGDLPSARKHCEESLEICRRLAGIDPVNTQWQRALTMSLNKVGGILEQSGDLTGALRNYEESLEISRRLAEKDPGNTQWQRDLSVSLNNVAAFLKENGDLITALLNYEESLEISRRLAEKDSSNTQWQRDLSVSLDNVADILEKNGDLTTALRNYKESLEIRRKLTEKDPSNALWHMDLAISLYNVTKILKQNGDLTSARIYYEESLETSRRLAEKKPGNIQWQLDLITGLNNVANILKLHGDLPSARKCYEESREIIRRLAEKEPGNTL